MIKSKQLENTLRSESNPFDTIYSDRTVGDLNGAIRFTALNNTGATINAYSVVYINGVSGNTPTIALADADAAAMPAFGLTVAQVTTGNEVDVITFGNLKGVDTSLLSVGTVLYVSTVPGQYTDTPPTGSSAKLQNIGMVVKSDANGIIKVGGAGRSAATPNLDEGKFFIGNASNQSSQSAYALPTADGSANQVLSTDGSGQLSFVDQAGGGGSAADDITLGDAAVIIATTVGDITIDAQGNDTDIIFKGTDNNVDIEMLRLDASDNGNAIFNNDIKMSSDGANLFMGANNEVYIQHQHNKGLRFYVSSTETGNDEPNFTFWNGADVSRGPQLELVNTQGANYADGDICGSLEFLGNIANSTLGTYAICDVVMANTTNQAGAFDFKLLKGSTNSMATAMYLEGTTSGSSTLDISDHNGVAGGLKLGGTLVTSTAAELNFLDTSTKSPSNGDVLTYNGTSLVWSAPSGGGNGTSYTYSAITATTTAQAWYHYSVDTSAGAVTLNLPALSSVTDGDEIRVKLRVAGNDLTIDANSTETIDGSQTQTLSVATSSITLVAGSTEWEIV